MGTSTGAARRRERRTALWHGYRRPVWRDRLWWASWVLSLVLVLVGGGLTGVGTDPERWAISLAAAALLTMVTFTLMGIAGATVRSFTHEIRGHEGPNPAMKGSRPERRSRRTRSGNQASSAGSTAPGAASTTPVEPVAPAPAPASTAAPASAAYNVGRLVAPDVSLDHKARALGRAFSAARSNRRPDQPPPD